MVRLYTALRLAAMGVCAAFLLAGCPGSDLTGLLESQSDNLTNLSEDDVFQVLGIVVEADTLEAEPTTEPDDDEPYFGEDPALYAELAPQAVELPEESVNSETETDFGVEPAAVGRLAGRFWNDRPDSTSDESGGVFRGRWFSAAGEVQGVLRGDYHPLPPDDLPEGLIGGGWFHGRYIDSEGRFRGWLRGRYGHAQGGRGLFFGHWLDRSFRLVGVLKGHWIDDPELNGGWFAGRWAAFNICHEADSLPELEGEGLSAAELAGLQALEDPGELDGLDALDETDLLDEIDLRDAEEPPCIELDRPHGFLRGWHWPYPPDEAADADGGVFRGRWRDAHANALGILFGRYVPRSGSSGEGDASGELQTVNLHTARPSGGLSTVGVAEAVSGDPQSASTERHVARASGVFYGRYVDRSGYPRGYVRGVYGSGPHGVGVFRGRYFNLAGEPMGILRGRWDNAPQRPGGPFFGIWVGADLDNGE